VATAPCGTEFLRILKTHFTNLVLRTVTQTQRNGYKVVVALGSPMWRVYRPLSRVTTCRRVALCITQINKQQMDGNARCAISWTMKCRWWRGVLRRPTTCPNICRSTLTSINSRMSRY